jgi:hypothetical protein
MTVRYHTRRGVEVPDYQCMNRCIQDGAARCQTIPGAAVDDAVASLLLDTLTPHALEVALTVQAELDTRAAEADALRRGHVERARHRADLARRRYLAVDPENRLVADSASRLERRYGPADPRGVQRQRRRHSHPADDWTDRTLATDFPTLWSTHTPADHKRMVTCGRRRHPAQDDRILHVRLRRTDPTSSS